MDQNIKPPIFTQIEGFGKHIYFYNSERYKLFELFESLQTVLGSFQNGISSSPGPAAGAPWKPPPDESAGDRPEPPASLPPKN